MFCFIILFSEQVEDGGLCSRRQGTGRDGGWPGWACLFRTGGAALQFYILVGCPCIKSLFIQNKYVFLRRENELELAGTAKWKFFSRS